MNINNTYDVLIVGGGISACVFASNYLINNPDKKIALIEVGRGLGGRSSTRISKKFEGWELNHGSPNLNIRSKNNNLVKNFIKDLLKKRLIRFDDSDLINLGNNSKFGSIQNLEFMHGDSYVSNSSMKELSQRIITSNKLGNQIDFFFETLINKLDFKNNNWYLTSKNGEKYKSHYLICTSNLLLHKRSMEILNTNQIPIRNAIPKNKDKKIDELLNYLDRQSYIPRLTFLIYTKPNYGYKDFYSKKFRYFNLNKDLESKFKFERIIFQFQKNNKLGIVIHSKSLNLIEDYLNGRNEDKFKQKILQNFNDIFLDNSCINQLSGNEDVSIMRWRASQPYGASVPLSLQFSRKYNIGFCGDWFQGEGFGRIEGAIFSSLKLVNKFKSLN